MNNVLTGQPITDEQFSELSDLANKQIALEAEIEILEKTVELRKERLNVMMLDLLPNKMQELGMSAFTLSNGATITIDDFFSAGIPSQTAIKKDPTKIIQRQECFKWLKENEGATIIKSEVIVSMNKGQEKEITKVVKVLEKAKIPFNLIDDVHWQTLRSFLKERIQAGADVPRALFSVFEGKKAKITVVKTMGPSNHPAMQQ